MVGEETPCTAEAPQKVRGSFISFEGGEGSGKTTQVALLADRVRAAGREVLLVREPGGTMLGERVRKMVLDPVLTVTPVAEALLFAAARAQQVVELILPALDAGKVVITDRYIDSSIAYQGVARGCGIAPVEKVNQWAVDGLQPDLTFLLDIPVERGFERLAGRSNDRIEQEDRSFHEQVRSGYLEAVKRSPERFEVIDANGPPELIAELIWERTRMLLDRG